MHIILVASQIIEDKHLKYSSIINKKIRLETMILELWKSKGVELHDEAIHLSSIRQGVGPQLKVVIEKNWESPW